MYLFDARDCCTLSVMQVTHGGGLIIHLDSNDSDLRNCLIGFAFNFIKDGIYLFIYGNKQINMY